MNDGCNKTPEIPLQSNMQYVLDGGSLLHRLRAPWRKGSSFGEIVQAYVQFVDEHYPNSVVVFNGYTIQLRTIHHRPDPSEQIKGVDM